MPPQLKFYGKNSSCETNITEMCIKDATHYLKDRYFENLENVLPNIVVTIKEYLNNTSSSLVMNVNFKNDLKNINEKPNSEEQFTEEEADDWRDKVAIALPVAKLNELDTASFKDLATSLRSWHRIKSILNDTKSNQNIQKAINILDFANLTSFASDSPEPDYTVLSGGACSCLLGIHRLLASIKCGYDHDIGVIKRYTLEEYNVSGNLLQRIKELDTYLKGTIR